MTAVQEGQAEAPTRIELDIGGMTCASCAARIEKRLNRIDGAHAVVNLATERAVVTGLPASATEAAIAAVVRAGYTARPVTDDTGESNHPARLRALQLRLVVAALLTLPLSNLSLALALVPTLRFPGWEWVCVALATPVVAWCAWPFHRASVRNLRHGAASMDTLVSLGVLAAYGWAVVTALLPGAGGGSTYWLGFGLTPDGADAMYLEVAAAVTTFLLIGRYFEARARRSAAGVLHALRGLAATAARVRRADGTEATVPATMLRRGEIMLVRPGEQVPADGVVVAGRAAVDTSMLTGEPVPRDVEPGDEVLGGAVSRAGALEVRAERVGPHSQLEQVAALAEQAQARKARVHKLVDRVVAVFVPIVLVVAVGTLTVWLLLGHPPRDAFAAALAVLVISCPCAMGLATPMALMVGVGRAGRLGIVIKGPDALEASGVIDTVVLDKTGTVTTGRLQVCQLVAHPPWDEPSLRRLAATAERDSEHPVGRALARLAEPDPGTDVSGFTALPGAGAQVVVDGVAVVLGTAALFDERGLELPTSARELEAAAAADARLCVHVARDGAVVGSVALADAVKESAAAAVGALRSAGLRTVLLTGDTTAAGQRVGAVIGVDEVIAEVLPTDKAATVARLRSAGHRVAMVGDGINDAAALAEADLGIAMVSGTDLAMRSADIIVVRRDLGAVVDAITLSRRTLRVIRGNLVWAFAYNVAAIPLAALGLLNPLIAGLAMSLSSLFVVGNSLRLRSAAGSGERGRGPATPPPDLPAA